MVESTIATAADYADALITARRGKNWFANLLLLILVAQLAIFFTARYTDRIFPGIAGDIPSTQPAAVGVGFLRYFVAISCFAGIVLDVVLAVVVLVMLHVLLVGRLLGVALVTSAFLTCILLAVLLFPWQAYLNFATASGTYQIPGVLYTWSELARDAKFNLDGSLDLTQNILKWARFVVFPVVTILLVLTVQSKTKRALRLALGGTSSGVEMPLGG